MSSDRDNHTRVQNVTAELEGRLHSIADNIPSLIALMTPDGRVATVNRLALEYYGATLEELRGWAAGDTVHPDDLPTVVAAWMKSVRTGSAYDIKHRIRRADGIYRWFHVRGLPLKDPEGSITGWCVSQTDIDDQNKAEEALRSAERELRSIINTIPTMAWSSRPDGHCDFLNQRWTDYAGLSVDEAQGWGWRAAIHPDDREPLLAYWQSHLASGSAVDTEARIRRFDGVYRWFIFRANALRDESGAIVKWYGTNVDIEDRKQADEALSRARAELAQVSRMTSLGALTASIAHEVTQPLTAIVANAGSCLRWLSREPPNLDRARSDAERIIQNGYRAGNVVQSICSLARQSPAEMVTLDFNKLIIETLDLMKSELQRDGVSLETSLLTQQSTILGDQTQLQQLIVNLVMNGLEAIKATSGAPRVLRVVVESARDGGLYVRVEDSGAGIDPELLERIFEPMFTTKPGGMGLGLSICRSIVEAHGGRLWVSPNPMGGSVFQFCIPEAMHADAID
jgi:PAS domain S-box-containing protein